MAKSTFSGGEKLSAFLRATAARLAGGARLQVGFIEHATEANGALVAAVAAINEFGGTMTVPAHETTIHRSLNERTGEFRRSGRFVKAAASNFATTHVVPEYTVTIPPRPFFRGMFAKESPHWGDDLGKVLVATDYDIQRTLDLMGEEINGELIEAIRNFTDPPNAPSTIAGKGFDKPLEHTGTMLGSTSWQIEPTD